MLLTHDLPRVAAVADTHQARNAPEVTCRVRTPAQGVGHATNCLPRSTIFVTRWNRIQFAGAFLHAARICLEKRKALEKTLLVAGVHESVLAVARRDRLTILTRSQRTRACRPRLEPFLTLTMTPPTMNMSNRPVTAPFFVVWWRRFGLTSLLDNITLQYCGRITRVRAFSHWL